MKVFENSRELWQCTTKSPAEKFIRSLSITADQPGTIVRDANALLHFLDGTPIPTKSEHLVPPMKDLDAINQLMSEPMVHKMPRPQLRSFPTLAGLYVLLRTIGLVTGRQKPKRAICVDTEMRDRWNELNATEQYVALLSACLYRASIQSIGYDARFPGLHSELANTYIQLHDEQTICQAGRGQSFDGWEDRMYLSLLRGFGFVEVDYDTEVEKGKSAVIAKVRRLPLGDAMFITVFGTLVFERRQEDRFFDRCKSLFPDLKQQLSVPTAEFQPGEFTLKISVGDCSRTMAVPAETDLQQLADDILDAFEFDHDHLFLFGYRDRSGVKRQIYDGRFDDGEMFADETRLGDLPLESDASFFFDYDFGDTTRFTIKIQKKSDQPSKLKTPKVIGRVGDPPNQYYWDDDGYDDEDE